MHSPCKHPFFSLSISESGSLNPCCAYAGRLGTANSVTSIRDEWLNSPIWKNFRNNELDSKWNLPGCTVCKSNQEMGVFTRKDIFKDFFLDKKLDPFVHNCKVEHLDISLSNSCNLTCVMECGREIG